MNTSLSRRVAAEFFTSEPRVGGPMQPPDIEGYSLTRRVLAGLLGVRLPPRQDAHGRVGADLHGTDALIGNALPSGSEAEISATAAAKIVAKWPAYMRLNNRKAILEIARALSDASGQASDLFLPLDRSYDTVVQISVRLSFERRRGRVDFRSMALDLEHELASVRRLAVSLSGDLEKTCVQARGLGRSRVHVGASDLDFAATLARAVTNGFVMVKDLVLTLDRVLHAIGELTDDTESVHQVGYVRSIIQGIARELAEEDRRLCDYAISLVHDLSRSVETLKHAANNVMDGDLSGLTLEDVDLIGLRWNWGTSWPRGWTDRIRDASIEEPEGSGQFVIRPAFDNDSAELAPVGA